MDARVTECQTLSELAELERAREEQGLVFDFQPIGQWRAENQQLELSPEISDNWTPAQRERFLHDWNDDELILQANRGEKRS